MKIIIFAFIFLILLVGQSLLTTHYSLQTNDIVFAQKIITNIPDAPVKKLGGLGIESLVIWLIGIFWIVAVGFVVWAAFTFLFANGDEGKIGEAKNRLKYAVIAAAVALLATGIDVIVGNLLGGN